MLFTTPSTIIAPTPMIVDCLHRSTWSGGPCDLMQSGGRRHTCNIEFGIEVSSHKAFQFVDTRVLIVVDPSVNTMH